MFFQAVNVLGIAVGATILLAMTRNQLRKELEPNSLDDILDRVKLNFKPDAGMAIWVFTCVIICFGSFLMKM